MDYDFDEDFDRINSLMEECDRIDYLEGESVLLTIKCQMAVSFGREELIFDWIQSYKEKIARTVGYGMADRELYYKVLALQLETLVDGFEYHKENIENLLMEAKRKKDNHSKATILFNFYLNSQEDDKEIYRLQLEQLYRDNDDLKMTWTYLAFQNQEGIIKSMVDNNKKTDYIVSLPYEIDMLLIKAESWRDKDYQESLGYLIEANNILPNNEKILTAIINTYLHLYRDNPELKFIKNAKKHSLKGLALFPNSTRMNYNLACIYSIENKIDSSYYFLENSLMSGYTDYYWMIQDVDLETLRDSIDIYKLIEQYDGWAIANKHFSEMEEFSKKLKLEKFNILANYRKFITHTFSISNTGDTFDNDRLYMHLDKVKAISVDVYLQEIEDAWETDSLEFAKMFLLEYIQLSEELLNRREQYITKNFNSSLEYYNSDQTFEEYKAAILSDPYEELAKINLKESDIDNYLKNMKQAVYHEEILATSDYLLITKYTSLATQYSKIDDHTNSKLYISKAERLLKRQNNFQTKILATITIYDYYNNGYSDTDNEIIFRKALRLLKEVLEEAEAEENHQYQYWCLLRLGEVYYNFNNTLSNRLQYDYLAKADSLYFEFNLDISPLHYSHMVYSVFMNNNEYDRIRRISNYVFEYEFLNENYINAFNNGFMGAFTYLYKHEGEEKDYFNLKAMLSRYDDIEKGKYWSLYLTLAEMQVELIKHLVDNTFDKSLKMISQYINMKNDVYNEDYASGELRIAYLWIGKRILSGISEIGDNEKFQELLVFIEPLQWDDPGIISDGWFINFVNTNYGPYNAELYKKYNERILSYPLSIERLNQKFYHANLIYNLYGNITESINLYEECLLEAKQLGEIEIELDIISELAYKYGRNRQSNLSLRYYWQALDLAKSLGDNIALESIYTHMIDMLINVDHPQYYELTSEYLKVCTNNNSFRGRIEAIGSFLDYFLYLEEPDSVAKYMLEGFSLKDSVIINVAPLSYLSFVSECFNYLNQASDQKIIGPIKEFVFDGKVILNPNYQKIYEEMIYLKDYDFSVLDQNYIKDYPFVYLNAIQSSVTLREFWDGNYLQTNQFSEILEFCLSLDEKNREWGLINAFWIIERRIKKLEDYDAIGEYYDVDKFFGYGITYDIDKLNRGLEITGAFAKSPSNGKFNYGDVILINSDEEITKGYAKEFMNSQINKAIETPNGSTIFKVLRNGTDTLSIELKPGDVQPNYYSEYPIKETRYLMDKVFDIADSLFQNSGTIRSFSTFTNRYREFLIAYPWRYLRTNDGVKLDSYKNIELLDRYEMISTFNLVNQSIEHKANIEDNPILMDEYLKYSSKINQIQLGLQESDLNENELNGLQAARSNAYNELSYFENYSPEKSSLKSNRHKFSFNENLDMLDEFDLVIRYCNTNYLNNAVFIWNKSNQEMKSYYTSSEEKIKTKVKVASQLLSYSVGDTTLNDNLQNAFIDLFCEINGSQRSPIFGEEDKQERNVLIIPDGEMNFFPNELLPIRFESDTTNYFYYGEFANITYAPSLSSFTALSKRREKNKNKVKALLVSANPNSESTTNYMDNLMVMRSDYGNIEFVDNEINSIDKILSKRKFLKKGTKTTTYDSKSITETAFKSAGIEDYKYIHIAAHGVHDNDNPRYSGILLGRNEEDNEDGILQAHEIFPLNLNADLVTLSSCFSGFGEIDPNEGNLGIYRSFLIAGAKSVIISLWNVEDESTALLFTKFYEYLKEGNSKARSLRLAKMYLKNETRFSHPFYWAPFILMGEA